MPSRTGALAADGEVCRDTPEAPRSRCANGQCLGRTCPSPSIQNKPPVAIAEPHPIIEEAKTWPPSNRAVAEPEVASQSSAEQVDLVRAAGTSFIGTSQWAS